MSILHFINQEVVLPPKPFLSAQFNGFQSIHTYVPPSPWLILTRALAFREGGVLPWWSTGKTPYSGGLGSIPGQGTGSHRLLLAVQELQLKIY